MKKPVDVYLAGGMRSGWQDRVKADLRKLQEKGLVRWSDPRDNYTKIPEEYKLLDIMRVKTADIIFGFAEDSNPGIYAMCVEMAIGHTNGSHTILVNELDETRDPARYRSFGFISTVCDFQTAEYDKGLVMLEKMILALAGE